MDLRGILWSVGALVWGVAAIGFWTWTTRYEFATPPETELASPAVWPADTRLVLSGDRPTLLFFMHPRCPCTRASVRELERTLARASLPGSRQPDLIVVAALPQGAGSAWRDTDTLRSAAKLPRAETFWDMSGIEASRFGVTTSGTIKLYDPSGKLLFSGGITISRGHEGDSAGGDRLCSSLNGTSRVLAESTPVFGCRLYVERSTSNRAEGGSS